MYIYTYVCNISIYTYTHIYVNSKYRGINIIPKVILFMLLTSGINIILYFIYLSYNIYIYIYSYNL